MLKVLELYREDSDPEICDLDGKALSTFSKEESLAELEKRGIDGLKLFRLGLIDPRPEELCKLVHYAVGLNDDGHVKEKDTEEPPQKKQKKGEEVTVSRRVLACYLDLKAVLIGTVDNQIVLEGRSDEGNSA